jgi:hypothetical protein
VDTGLLVACAQECSLGALLGEERRSHIEFKTRSDLVLKLKLTFQDIGGGPGLGEDKTVLFVGVFGLKVTSDSGRARGAVSSDLEKHVGRSFGFYFQTVS